MRPLRSGAQNKLDCEIAAYADENADIYVFSQFDGSPFDLTDLDIVLQFRCNPRSTSADVTLSTTEGSIEIIDNPSAGVANIIRITVAAGRFASFIGDMITDLIFVDATGTKFLWAHGVTTVCNNPASF